jgi:hypothetical protein
VTSNPRVIVGFDPAGDHSIDAMVFATLVRKQTNLKDLALKYTEEEFKHLVYGTPLYPITNHRIKENPSMTTKLRIPSDTVERRDIAGALEALGSHDIDYVFNMIAVFQELEEGEIVKRASKLTKDDLGKHVTVIDGEHVNSSGWVTDVTPYHDARNRDNLIEMVLDGKIVKPHYQDFVIVSDRSQRDNSDLLQG